MSSHRLVASISHRMNASVLDEWSLVHAGAGIAAGLVGLNPWVFLAIATGYEVAEFFHEYPKGSPFFGSKAPEWEANMVADVGVAALGYAFGVWARTNRDENERA